jgi:hypothetical protein
MTTAESRLITALEQSEHIAEATLATLASITLARVERPVVAVALASGAVINIAPDHVIAVAEQRLFDALMTQLQEVKAVAAELTKQLTADPPIG